MKGKLSFKISAFILIVFLMALYIYPLLFVFNASLKTEKDFIMNNISLTNTFSIANYALAWQRAKFDSYILNSLFYTIVCTGLSLILAVFVAFPISRKYIKYSAFIYALFVAGMFLPDGTIPQFQMFLKLHLYNTRFGYMIGMIGGGGITMLFLVTYLKSIPKDFDEAASIDGCGYFRYMFSIVIPLIKPALASMGILAAIGVWNDIIRSCIYLSNEKLYPITRGLFVFTGQFNNEWTLRTAALIIVALPLLILYLFLQRYIIDGAVAGAIKS